MKRRIAMMSGLIAVATLLMLMVMYFFTSIPSPAEVSIPQSTVVLDARGKLVGRLFSGEDRVIVPRSQIPKVTRNAVIAAEDRGFYRHKGVSVAGVARAALANLFARKIEQGGSTITQQYAKNAFVGRKRTYSRKVREALVAVKLERKWSKDEILEAYLNTIYFGRGAYGIEAAARAYFGVESSRLTLAQSALLAGIIRAPEALDPSRKEQAALRARSRVLRAMAEEQMITEQEREAAAEEKLVIRPRRAAVSGKALHFLDSVRRELVNKFGEDAVYRSGLKVVTTLNLAWQEAAEKAVGDVLDRATDPEAALVAVDPKTGSVRALVGGRDYAKRQFDLATQARRQPGSSFKPFVLAALLEKGGSLSQSYRAPARIKLDLGDRTWSVGNYDLRDYGSLSVERATANSVNTVYAQMILDAGPQQVAALAKRMGVASELEPVASLALGTEEVTTVELASSYATLANDGRHVAVHMITKVTDRHGEQLYRFSEGADQAIPQRTARLVTRALVGVVENGTGERAALDRPTAGKTGTTENHRDAWFAGYTAQLASAVWMGFPDGTTTMENVRGIKVTGGSFPARIWKQFMSAAHEGLPDVAFPSAADQTPSPSASSPVPTSTRSEPPPLPTGTVPVPTNPETLPPQPSEKPKPKPTQSPSPSPSPTQSGGGGTGQGRRR